MPVGAGTDATRVASYNPWVSLYWLVTGRTVGGLPLYGDDNRLDREEALRLWTEGSAWFSSEEDAKGRLKAGQFADLACCRRTTSPCPTRRIQDITSVLTMVGGKVVHGDRRLRRAGAAALPGRCPTGRRCATSAATRAAPLAQAGRVQHRRTSARAHAWRRL